MFYNLDVMLIHPPSIYDFRKRVAFSGPIAYTVGESTDQFMIYPVGLLSIAEYLERFGYRAVVDNICDRMLNDSDFDVEQHIRKCTAKVFGIDLHWIVHSQGALEIARLCKILHPDSLVVLGGMTSSVFHEEIIQKYDFVDAVIRGESEKPFISLMQAFDKGFPLDSVPNVTCRDNRGNIVVSPMMVPDDSIDEYEYTRLDLLDTKGSIFNDSMPAGYYSLPICRGCIHNCASCGGSAYSYRKYFNRKKPAFRSPQKLVEDIIKLSRQGVKYVFLFQDPRMGGEKYWKELLRNLSKVTGKVSQITLELFGPADEEYLKALSCLGTNITLSMSPESMVENVRNAHGRRYNNEDIFRTMKLCKKYGLPIGIFTMLALANDTKETVQKDWQSWEKICQFNVISPGTGSVHYGFGPMILLDPGSLAFNYPEKYGYRLLFNNLEDYIYGMLLPSWHQWISYETEFLNKKEIASLIIDSLEYSIGLREKYGIYNKYDADMNMDYFVDTSRKIMSTLDLKYTLF